MLSRDERYSVNGMLIIIDIPKAIEYFKKALSINPKFVPSLYHLGLVYHANRQIYPAIEQFSKVLK